MDVIKNGLFNRAFSIMGEALNLRLSRNNVSASNLANMDVPGYRMKDLDFEGTLQQALGPEQGRLEMRRTNAAHLPAQDLKHIYGSAESKIRYSIYGRDDQGNDLIDIDQEMTKLAKNHLLYNTTVQMLSTAFEGLKYAISEGGQ
jgi:flagellar basal-body rod protein FlgB